MLLLLEGQRTNNCGTINVLRIADCTVIWKGTGKNKFQGITPGSHPVIEKFQIQDDAIAFWKKECNKKGTVMRQSL